MLDSLRGIHIELTNMCTLKCPRCSRTKFIDMFPNQWSNKNLNLNNLKNFLDIDLTGIVINLCGNYGDPIYYDKLFDAVDFFKERDAVISIATNGSYQQKEWWEQLSLKLTDQDSIIFAIDGLPETFSQYRINANWESIKQGIEITAASAVKLIWQYIVFSFNENDIEEAKKMSIELGFDEFKLVKTDRFDNDNDWLKPSINLVGDRNSAMVYWKNSLKKELEITPRCKQLNNHHYISADGIYMPCCFAGEHNFYYKSEFYKNRNEYDISTTTLSQLLKSNRIIDFYSKLEDAKLNYCTFNCPKL